MIALVHTSAARRVKDMLSYLQLVSNPSYTPALLRVLNVPKRGIGDKTQRDIVSAGTSGGGGGGKKGASASAWGVCLQLAQGRTVVKMTDAQRKGIKALVLLVKEARKKADEVRRPSSARCRRRARSSRADADFAQMALTHRAPTSPTSSTSSASARRTDNGSTRRTRPTRPSGGRTSRSSRCVRARPLLRPSLFPQDPRLS